MFTVDNTVTVFDHHVSGTECRMNVKQRIGYSAFAQLHPNEKSVDEIGERVALRRCLKQARRKIWTAYLETKK